MSDLLAQNWGGLYPLMAPNPGIPFLQDSINLNSQQMAQHVDQYFRDIGFEGQRSEFFERSVFVQRTFQMSCEKSAWDFQTSDEFRISLCAKPTRKDIHEMIYLFASGSKIRNKIRIKNDLHDSKSYFLMKKISREISSLNPTKRNYTISKHMVNYQSYCALRQILLFSKLLQMRLNFLPLSMIPTR